MSKTMDLANAYSTLGDNLDALFASLESQGQANLAQQVKSAENAIERAARDLNALDAVDTLQRPADQQTLQELTDGMNDRASAIRVQETRVASVCQLCASLVLVVTHFKSGDPLGAVAAARNAVAQFASLTG